MNLKDIKQRILSVKGTQKITQAMKLVSAAKLRRAQLQIEGMRPYQHKLDSMVSSFVHHDDAGMDGLAAKRDVRRVAIVAVASDTSLCGAFNSNVIRLMRGTVDDYRSQGSEVEMFPVGQKMYDAAVKSGASINNLLEGQSKSPVYNDVASVAYALIDDFKSGRIDKVEIVYTRFASTSKHVSVREQLLPLKSDEQECEGKDCAIDYIVEPGRAELLQTLLPKVVALNLYTALLDSVASEHAARMIAMQIASDNANDLITELTLEYNKGRQQAITNELLDIVSGSVSE